MMARRLAAAFLLLGALPAAAAETGTTSGHLIDVGIVPYVQDSDRGGGKLEARLNLARSDTASALYVTASVGLGSWFFTRKPSGFGKAMDIILVVPWIIKTAKGDYKRKEGNYTEWKTKQTFGDFGLAAGLGGWLLAGGITVVGYDVAVDKLINNDPYHGTLSGTAWGGYGQVGRQFPIGSWSLDVSAGYRETRGTAKVTVTNASGATNIAPVRPIYGPYGSIGLRYRF